MSEPADRDDRFMALDRFAEQPAAASASIVPMQAFSAGGDRIIGAQKVAIYRDDQVVMRKLKLLAAAAGDNWYYRFPVKNRKEDRTDFIEGPSIKLANDLARIYGNCDVDLRVQDIGDAWIFHARFTDFETGFSMSRPFQQRKSGARIGGSDDARRLDIALQIGASKAIRNVVCNALQTYADFAFEEAKNALVDRIGKELDKWRERTTRRLEELKVDVKRVERTIGRTVAEWRAPDVAHIVAMMKAVQDGMATLDETFAPLEQPAEGPKTDALDQFVGKAGEQTTGVKVDRPEVAAGIDSTDTAIESDAYKLAQEIVIACEKALTPEATEEALAGFTKRIKALGRDDRLDVSSIGQAYGQWRRGEVTEKQCETSVFDRLELVKSRSKKGGKAV